MAGLLFLACGMTVLIELVFFLLMGQRHRSFIVVCICANVATNLSLNLLLMLLALWGVFLRNWIYPLEALVVLCEFGIYAALLRPSKKLFLLTLAANALSYGAGLLVFGHV